MWVRAIRPLHILLIIIRLHQKTVFWLHTQSHMHMNLFISNYTKFNYHLAPCAITHAIMDILLFETKSFFSWLHAQSHMLHGYIYLKPSFFSWLHAQSHMLHGYIYLKPSFTPWLHAQSHMLHGYILFETKSFISWLHAQ